MLDSFETDIPLNVAQAAHNGTSHTPEKRAVQERDGYAATLRADFANLLEHADTDEKQALLVTEFERYRAGYRARFLAYLGARARCVSTLVTGGSNFPVARMQKRGATADRRGAELAEYRKRALAAIRRTLTPELQPILTSDANAVKRLDDKATALETKQALMKATNKALRANAKEPGWKRVDALVALGHSKALAYELCQPDELGRIGYADYQLKNNNAQIRAARERSEAIVAIQAQPIVAQLGANGVQYEDNPTDNRVRLTFGGKPAADVRERLKRNGFRWAPTLGCWQAFRNLGSLTFAANFAGVEYKPEPAAPFIACTKCGAPTHQCKTGEPGCRHCDVCGFGGGPS